MADITPQVNSDTSDVFSYIKAEENNWRTARVPITRTKSWNMFEHIERCTNVANAWFNKGANDGKRPYNDIVTPIIDVAFRSEGFDVKHIIPYVNDADNYYKSFLVKKYHPQWARRNELDTFIDDVVETSIIFDLVLIKNVNEARPEVVDLSTVAFCDQTDVLAGALCIKHNMTVGEVLENKGKWYDDVIDIAINEALSEKKVALANDETVKTPSKYIEVYELRGSFPETWLDPEGDLKKYTPQMHIVAYYTNTTGNKQGLCLYKGKDKPLKDNFKALKIDKIRSRGRACGRSVVERLFDPQVWANYSGLKIKELLDSAINVFITDSEELGNQKLSDLKLNTILKQEKGAMTQRLDGTLQNLPAFQSEQVKQENAARTLGSASEASLGKNPVSGTPFALQQLIVQQGDGIHEYRKGKIATFFADVLYRDLILQYLVDDMNKGKKFSEELSLDELQEVSKQIVTNTVNDTLKEMVLNGEQITPEIQQTLTDIKREEFMDKGSRRFFEVVEGELKDLPIEVMVNVAGKQRNMVENADKITNILREVIANPQAFSQIPGVAKAFNELLEESGMSPIDFTSVTNPMTPQPQDGIIDANKKLAVA